MASSVTAPKRGIISHIVFILVLMAFTACFRFPYLFDTMMEMETSWCLHGASLGALAGGTHFFPGEALLPTMGRFGLCLLFPLFHNYGVDKLLLSSMLSGWYYLSGDSSFAAYHLFFFLFSMGLVALVYLCASRLANAWCSFMAGGIMALSNIFLFHSTVGDHVILGLFFFLAAFFVYLYSGWWGKNWIKPFLIGVLLGAAVTSSHNVIPLVGLILLGTFLIELRCTKTKGFLKLARHFSYILAGLPALPILYFLSYIGYIQAFGIDFNSYVFHNYFTHLYGKISQNMLYGHYYPAGPGWFLHWLTTLESSAYAYALLALTLGSSLLLVVRLWRSLKRGDDIYLYRGRSILLFMFIGGFLFLEFSGVTKLGRIYFTLIPFMALLSGLIIFWLTESRRPLMRALPVVILLAALAFFNLPLLDSSSRTLAARSIYENILEEKGQEKLLVSDHTSYYQDVDLEEISTWDELIEHYSQGSAYIVVNYFGNWWWHGKCSSENPPNIGYREIYHDLEPVQVIDSYFSLNFVYFRNEFLYYHWCTGALSPPYPLKLYQVQDLLDWGRRKGYVE